MSEGTDFDTLSQANARLSLMFYLSFYHFAFFSSSTLGFLFICSFEFSQIFWLSRCYLRIATRKNTASVPVLVGNRRCASFVPEFALRFFYFFELDGQAG